jgi:archaellum component FlaC
MDNKRVEILLEEIKSNVKLALEGHDILRNEIRESHKELKQEIGDLKSALEYVAKKVDLIDKKLDAHIRQPAHI